MTGSKRYTGSGGFYRWRNEEANFHRLDGPALTSKAGTKHWYIDGKRHRLDGPAIEYYDGFKAWWVDGERLSQEQFEQHPLVIFYRLCQESL